MTLKNGVVVTASFALSWLLTKGSIVQASQNSV
jgi:hypothetical protein